LFDYISGLELLKKDSNIHWRSRSRHDVWRAGGENFWTGRRCPNFSYFYFFYFL